ncbi:hypothetical protein E6Q11_05950 [Candidatus Dojkabacteria bacterium]|uniref:Uncharacterized protein n=1 Tax=Candidatus Dojkabacteria bacterium TaxID=2099670 RepID=A0A5C7J5Q6_9BACT|nr:MAG: hypothetical protein E6Q11_05950 [Candidatus Dojkabacteria bacterium]
MGTCSRVHSAGDDECPGGCSGTEITPVNSTGNDHIVTRQRSLSGSEEPLMASYQSFRSKPQQQNSSTASITHVSGSRKHVTAVDILEEE